MSFPQVATTNSSTDAGTSHTVALPAGIVSGNLLLIFFGVKDAPTVTFPEGWAECFNAAYADQTRIVVAWRKADGDEGASIEVATSASKHSAHISCRITECADPTSQPPQGSTGVANISTTINPDALTPTGGAKDYLWFVMKASGLASAVTAYPTNYGNEIYCANSTLCDIAVARRELNAASEDPGAFTLASGWFNVAGTVAVHPVSLPPSVGGILAQVM